LFSRNKADEFSSQQVGEIISRFERKGFILKGLKLFQTAEELAQVGPGESDQHLFAICSSHKFPQLPHIGSCP
jgi:nucleoside diphosphate kinase